MRWTGHKVDFVEMLYSLQLSGSVNHGKITVKESAEGMGYIFNLDITKDLYSYYSEIKQRKIEKAKFLEHLIKALKRRIDDDDSK